MKKEEEIPDAQFKSEVMRLLTTVISKLGDHDKRFDDHDKRFDSLEAKVDKNTNQLKVLSGQLSDVGVMALEDNKRISKIERDIKNIQSSIH